MVSVVHMHPKPMIRHTSHIKPALASVHAFPPGDDDKLLGRKPGLYIHLSVDTPSGLGTQIVMFPMDSLDTIESAIKALRAVKTEVVA